MARCGCSQQCLCTIQDGDCTVVSGEGSVGAPFQIDVEIDPDAGNQLECGDDGLLVPAGPTELPITVQDTVCIDLEGDGTAGDPLTATPIVSAEPDNQLTCEPGPAPAAGLYVPPQGIGAIAIYGAMHLLGPFVTPGGTPSVLLSPWPYNAVLYDVGGIVDLGSSRFLIPPGGDGWYYIEAQWRDNTVANNFQLGLFGGFYQQNFGMSVTTGGVSFPGPFVSQDRLVENPHTYRVSCVRQLAAGDSVDFFWEILNTTGAACGPMAFNPILPPPGDSSENYATIAQIGL